MIGWMWRHEAVLTPTTYESVPKLAYRRRQAVNPGFQLVKRRTPANLLLAGTKKFGRIFTVAGERWLRNKTQRPVPPENLIREDARVGVW
jgi:hypothetical protein